jgi:hypothetical protein
MRVNDQDKIDLGPLLRKAGWAALVLGILFNPIIFARILTDDGQIASEQAVRILFAVSFILILSALFLFFRCKQVWLSREKFFELVLIALTTVVCLGLLEVGARIWLSNKNAGFLNIAGKIYPVSGLAVPDHYTFDPVTGYSLIPNINDKKQQITTDKNGFRSTGREFDASKESIIFVGDSTVFGWGVKDTDTFVYILSQENTFKNYNVINMGVPSYSVGHICQVLKYKVPTYNPHIVMVSILWPWKPYTSYSSPEAWKKVDYDFYKATIPRRNNYHPPHALRDMLAPHIYIVVRDIFYKFTYKKQIQENLVRPRPRDFDVTRQEEEKLAEEHIELLREAVEPLLRRGVKVIFYIHPYQHTLFSQEHRFVGRWGKELMLKRLGAYDPSEFIVKNFTGEPLFIDGCHLTPKGNQVFAQYLEGLVKNGLKQK